LALRQIRAYALLSAQGAQGPDYGGAPTRAPQVQLQEAAAAVISDVQQGKQENLLAIVSAAQAGNQQGIALLQLLAQDPTILGVIREIQAVGPDAASGADPRLDARRRLTEVSRTTVSPRLARAVASLPPHLQAEAQRRIAHHAARRPAVFRPGARPGYRPGYRGLLRPGGYRASWAWGRERWGHPGGGYRAGWAGWRRPGWR